MVSSEWWVQHSRMTTDNSRLAHLLVQIKPHKDFLQHTWIKIRIKKTDGWQAVSIALAARKDSNPKYSIQTCKVIYPTRLPEIYFTIKCLLRSFVTITHTQTYPSPIPPLYLRHSEAIPKPLNLMKTIMLNSANNFLPTFSATVINYK